MPLQLVSGEYADKGGFIDSAAAKVLKRMERKGSATGQPVIRSARAGTGPGSGSGEQEQAI